MGVAFPRTQTQTPPSRIISRGLPKPTAMMVRTKVEKESMGAEPRPTRTVLERREGDGEEGDGEGREMERGGEGNGREGEGDGGVERWTGGGSGGGRSEGGGGGWGVWWVGCHITSVEEDVFLSIPLFSLPVFLVFSFLPPLSSLFSPFYIHLGGIYSC